MKSKLHPVLSHALLLQQEGANDAAIDHLKSFIAKSLLDGRFNDVNELLGQCDPGDVPNDLVLAALEETRHVANDLPYRQPLKERTCVALSDTMENATEFFDAL